MFVTEAEMNNIAKEHAMSTDQLLSDRQSTHGDFSRNALISQDLKATLRQYGQGINSAVHQEALDMICLKMSRIASGQANFEDHWADIAGYAELARKACIPCSPPTESGEIHLDPL